MYIKVATLLIVCMLLVSCDPATVDLITERPADPSYPLAGSWVVESVEGQLPFGEHDPTNLETFFFYDFQLDGTWILNGSRFVEDTISLTAISGTYTTEGSSYTMTITNAGFIAIDPEYIEVSGTFVIEGETLTLSDELGNVIVLSAL